MPAIFKHAAIHVLGDQLDHFANLGTEAFFATKRHDRHVNLVADQRCRLLEDRYGYARTKNLLFQGLRRQTTRFLSALSGEKRTDIDR